MRLCLPFLLSSLAFFSLIGCSSADSSAGDEVLVGPGFAGGGAGQLGAGDPHGDRGGAPTIIGQGGKSGTAYGGSSMSSGTPGAPAPVTWNSAKSTLVTDSMLLTEYATWKLTHVESCVNGSAVVIKDGNVASQGIGYGLLLSVAMNDQPLFDGLLKYYAEHLDKNGLMNTSTGKCDLPGNDNTNSETDADLDTVMALVQAASRWAEPEYSMKAQALAAKIVQYETDMCSGRRVLRPSDAFGGCTNTGDPRLNPSYFSPGYYKVFAHYFPEQASTWTALVDGSYQLYALYQARMDDLVPDWSNADGSPDGSGYTTDASRTPFRVAVDYAWTGDTRAKTFMQNISTWVDAHGGLPSAAQMQNSAFVGSFALAGGYEQAKFDGYMSAWLGTKLDDTAYYPGTLRVLYLLVAAGKFSSTL